MEAHKGVDLGLMLFAGMGRSPQGSGNDRIFLELSLGLCRYKMSNQINAKTRYPPSVAK